MKKIFSLLFLAAIISSTVFGAELTDIENHWAKESIVRLIDASAINGYEDNTFQPDNEITIAEFLKILVEYSEYQKVLVGEMWPDWYINTAKHYHFILEDEFSDYDRAIMRNEVARILGRFIDLQDVKASKKKFSDTSDVAILKLVNLGVVTGYEDNTFKGENSISRAEAAVIICRAVKARRELTAQRKYSIQNAEKLTNIGREKTYDSYYSNRYEIKNNKLYFYDNGRYAKLDGFVVEDKNVENKTLVDLIKALIQEEAYVGVSYVPDKILYDQIEIAYGRQERFVYNHSYAFSFVFYPDRLYELRRVAMNDALSEQCFMKITVSRMWKDVVDLKNGEYAHPLNNEKLLKALKAVFDNQTATEIYDYIEEWLPKIFEEGIENKFVEVKKIGKYEVNLYTKNSDVRLYIAK
ncbi:MAG: S-layer homology domain-containing protein [Clostridia bacterium]|nr:S-layer homology domain-containing protein [Clostridia bacterium]